MSDLVSRIDSRIREILSLLGEQEVSKGTTSKNTSRVAFDMNLGGDAKLGFGSLPAIGDLKVLGLGENPQSTEPFKPDVLRPLAGGGAQSKSDAGVEALSAILNAESRIGVGGAGDINNLLPMNPLAGRNSSRLDGLSLGITGLGSPGLNSLGRSSALQRAVDAYRAGQRSAVSKTEDPTRK